MGAKTKKIKAFGKFGPGYGTRVRNRYNTVEAIQRLKQVCPHCSFPGVKRKSAGIWSCPKCEKVFAGHAYTLKRQV